EICMTVDRRFVDFAFCAEEKAEIFFRLLLCRHRDGYEMRRNASLQMRLSDLIFGSETPIAVPHFCSARNDFLALLRLGRKGFANCLWLRRKMQKLFIGAFVVVPFCVQILSKC